MKVGFSRKDMTPKLGIELSGYYEARVSDGILDRLFVNTVVVEDEGKRAVICCLDSLGCYSTEVADMWIHAVMEKADCPYEAVFICHTHTHTGPQYKSYRHPGYPENEAFLAGVLADSVEEAIADLSEVKEVRTGECETKGLMFVRRMQMKDGHYQTWAKQVDPNILRPASKADETVRLTRIIREKGEELAFVNSQNHPDMIGGTKISADFPGLFRNSFEASHENTKSIYFNGCEGQMTFRDYQFGTTPEVKSYDRAVKYGEMLSDVCSDLYQKTETVEFSDGTASLSEKKAPMDLSYGIETARCDAKYYPEKVEEAKQIVALHESGKDAEISAEKPYLRMGITAEAYHIINLAKKDIHYQDLPVSKLAFLGLAFVGFPGEPFCEIGMEVRKQSPYPVTFACCQTYVSFGYYPDAAAFDQDGYEPRNSQLKKGVGEKLIETAVALLNKGMC